MENEFDATVKAQIKSGQIHADLKLARFDGTNYTRWKDRMVFLLTALKIFYVLESDLTPIPDPKPDDSEALKKEHNKRKGDELVCRGYILNSLIDCLYNLYRNLSSPRDIWNALEMKYKNEKQGTDKFLAMKYFEFFMTDDKSTIMDQVHELQILVSRLNELEIKISYALQIGAILAKLPPSWNDFRKKFLHSNESTTVEQFQTHLQIEVENRVRDSIYLSLKVNYVAEGSSKKGQKHLKPKNKNNKLKRKMKVVDNACFHCGKSGHVIKDCRYRNNTFMRPPNLGTNNANNVEAASPELVAMVSDMQIGMITELHNSRVQQ